MRAPPQPLMQSPLLRSQTPAPPHKVSRFFRVWWLGELPRQADHPAYFRSVQRYLDQPFQPSTICKIFLPNRECS